MDKTQDELDEKIKAVYSKSDEELYQEMSQQLRSGTEADTNVRPIISSLARSIRPRPITAFRS